MMMATPATQPSAPNRAPNSTISRPVAYPPPMRTDCRITPGRMNRPYGPLNTLLRVDSRSVACDIALPPRSDGHRVAPFHAEHEGLRNAASCVLRVGRVGTSRPALPYCGPGHWGPALLEAWALRPGRPPCSVEDYRHACPAAHRRGLPDGRLVLIEFYPTRTGQQLLGQHPQFHQGEPAGRADVRPRAEDQVRRCVGDRIIGIGIGEHAGDSVRRGPIQQHLRLLGPNRAAHLHLPGGAAP